MNPAEVARSISETYAEFAVDLRYEDIPREVISKAKEHILDTVGCGLAGSTQDLVRATTRMVKRLGGQAEATIIGDGARVAAPNAALACGAACCALDYDDTGYWVGAVHSSRVLVPTSITVADWMQSSGKDLIKATIIGWEIANRIGNALGIDRERRYDLAAHYKILKRPLSDSNHFAAAAEAGMLMGLGRNQISSAIALVASFNGCRFGVSQSHREGADAMPLTAGWSAHAGVMAAMAAQEGLKGPRLVFEGDKGFFSHLDLGDLYTPEKLTENLGGRWYTLDNCIKFYPAGHGIHHWVESLKTVMREHKVSAEDVDEVVCHVPKQRVELHFDFPEQKLHPQQYNARFSLPFILATVLVDGDWNVASSQEAKLKNRKKQHLAKQVRYSFEEASWLEKNRGSLTVKTKRGKSYREKHPYLLGLPSNPPTHQQIVDKFLYNASFVLSKKSSEKLASTLEGLDQVKNVAEIVRLTVP